MLAQMDRTGEKGIFIIGATNYPDMIDPAMLRAGRLEKKFYLPPPDFEARKALFQISLDKRKKVLDFGIDLDILATITNNFVSADIEAIVNDSATIAMDKEIRISMTLLESCAKNYKPLSSETIKKYEAIRAEVNGEMIKNDGKPDNDRPRIGFKP
jgi:transitional endoplasmic reticulum ATPase